AASAIRSGDVMNEILKNPSQPCPNAEPGMTTTPCSSRTLSANVALGRSSGNAIQRYMVARGTSHWNPAARKEFTAASRRSLKILRLFGTNSAWLSSAATPAAWTDMTWPGSVNDLILDSTLGNCERPTAQPQRQPVMLYVFESEWNSI